MGHQLKYIREAVEDLDNIHQYISDNYYSESIAKATVQKIVLGVRILKENPFIGVSLDKKLERKIHPKHEVRMLILDQYLVFYTVAGANVYVLRVLNARQDYMNFLHNFSALAEQTEQTE